MPDKPKYDKDETSLNKLHALKKAVEDARLSWRMPIAPKLAIELELTILDIIKTLEAETKDKSK